MTIAGRRERTSLLDTATDTAISATDGAMDDIVLEGRAVTGRAAADDVEVAIIGDTGMPDATSGEGTGLLRTSSDRPGGTDRTAGHIILKGRASRTTSRTPTSNIQIAIIDGAGMAIAGSGEGTADLGGSTYGASTCAGGGGRDLGVLCITACS